MSNSKARTGFTSHLKDIVITCWQAFFSREVVHFPRVRGTGVATRPPTSEEVMKEIGQELDGLPEIHGDMTRALDLARSSLDEQIAQTNHQDDKNTKLLTIVSFLSAAAGAFFAKYIDIYPIHDATYRDSVGSWYWLILGAYIAFALFAVVASLGAMVSFYAIRTRFYWNDPTSDLSDDEELRSRLFFKNISAIRPKKWAQTFVQYAKDFAPPKNMERESPSRSMENQMAIAYFKDYVGESYLVAVKVAEKVRLVEHAQALLGWSINLLVVLLFLIASSFLAISPYKASPACCSAPGKSPTPIVDISKAPAPNAAIPLANSIVVNCMSAPPSAGGRVVNNTKTVNSKSNVDSSATTTNSTLNNFDAKQSNCPE
jgi:hypothetical protein